MNPKWRIQNTKIPKWSTFYLLFYNQHLSTEPSHKEIVFPMITYRLFYFKTFTGSTRLFIKRVKTLNSWVGTINFFRQIIVQVIKIVWFTWETLFVLNIAFRHSEAIAWSCSIQKVLLRIYRTEIYTTRELCN